MFRIQMRSGLLAACLLSVIGCGVRAPVARSHVLAQPELASVVAHYERGELRDAITALRRLVYKRDSDPHLHFMLGNALYRDGALLAAADEYGRATALAPEHLEAHVSRGFALYEVGDCGQAVGDWRSAVRINPEEAFARAALAVGLHCLGELELATTEYSESIRLDSRYGRPRELRIDIRWRPKAVAALMQLAHMVQKG